MNFNNLSSQYYNIYRDNCGIKIKKYIASRLVLKLEGKTNFCSNDCKLKYFIYCAKKKSDEKLLKSYKTIKPVD
jgi:hypothetical protein